MEQGVTFLNEPHNVPLPYEINNTYSPKKMSIDDYTGMLDNTNNPPDCDGLHCNYKSPPPRNTQNNTPLKTHHNTRQSIQHNSHNLHYGKGDITEMYQPSMPFYDGDIYDPTMLMSQCRDINMHMQKCVYCSSALNRQKYMLYLLFIIAILLFILIVINILKKPS